MAKLSAADRRALPAGDFALGNGRYPIPDKGHAMAAESDVSKFGTPAEKAKVDSAVRRKFPGMGNPASALAGAIRGG